MNRYQMVAVGILGAMMLFGIVAAVPISLDDPYFGDESQLAAGPEPYQSHWNELTWTPPQGALTVLPDLPVVANYQPSSQLATAKFASSGSVTKTENGAFHTLKLVNSVTRHY
jgi:hypothetical protein